MNIKHTIKIAVKITLLCLLVTPNMSCTSYKVPLISSINNFFTSIPRYADTNTTSVTVKKGDTLYSIAKKYNVSVRALINANRIKSPYDLRVGQKITIPSSAFHIVKDGDTLYSISRRYSVDVRSLAKLNNLSAPYSIYKGQQLTLPSMVEEEKASIQPMSKPDSTTKKNKSSKKKVTKTTKTTTTKKTSSSDKTKATAKSKAKPAPIGEPAARSSSKFAWPVKGQILLGFGDVGAGRHNDGINIKAPKGTSVKAADNGIVAYAGNELKGFGNLILIKHSSGWMTAYAHNDKITIKKGQNITRGQEIAKVGNTGNVNTPQLHFEVRKKSKAKDPLLYLEKK